MHTKSSKQVLSPLADAVAALIVIISESEITGAPTPDLSQLAKAVDTQIRNLVVVAKKIANQPSADDKLKKEMPIACEQVSDASYSLVGATSDLLVDPKSPAGRTALLEGAKGILSGTTAILNVFDDSEIFKILSATELMRSLLSKSFTMKLDPTGHEDFLHITRRLGQAITGVLQMAIKRSKDLLSPEMEKELLAVANDMKAESILYLSACKLLLSYTSSVEAKNIFAASQKVLEKLSLHIDAIVSSKDADEYFKDKFKDYTHTDSSHKYQDARQELISTPLSTMINNNSAEAIAKVHNYIDLVKEHEKDINSHLENITNSKATEVRAILEKETSKHIEELKKLVDPSCTLTDEQKSQAASHSVERIDYYLKGADDNVSQAVVAELIIALGEMSDMSNPGTTVGRLNEGINVQMVDRVHTATDSFALQARSMNALIDDSLKTLDRDHPLFTKLVDLSKEAKMFSPLVITSSEFYQKNHSETEAEVNLQTNLQRYTNVVMELKKVMVSQEGVFGIPELVKGAKLAADYHGKLLEQALKENKKDVALKELELVKSAAMQAISIVEREKENTADILYKSALEKEIKTLTRLNATVVELGSDLHRLKADIRVDDAGDLLTSVNSLKDAFVTIGTTVAEYKGVVPFVLELPTEEQPSPEIPAPVVAPELPAESVEVTELSEEAKNALLAEAAKTQDSQLRSLTSAIKEMVIVNEVAPKELSQEEAQENPIKAAGQELKVEASYWGENAVVIIVNSIAQKFLDLSNHHQDLSVKVTPSSKKSFIQTAQEILTETGNLIKAVDPLIMACADKRLVSQLQSTTKGIITLAQTLKVIAAVKASSPRDSDKSQQLISVAKNLTQSVKMILRDCISCSLRLKNSSPTDLVKFRKVVYAKRTKK